MHTSRRMTKGRGLTRMGGALVWMIGARASAQPVEGGAKPVERYAPAEEQERPDHVRPRGGLQIGGGAVFVPEHDSAGAAIQVSARLGVQINHYFGFYYQNSPTLLFAQDVQEGMRILAGFMGQRLGLGEGRGELKRPQPSGFSSSIMSRRGMPVGSAAGISGFSRRKPSMAPRWSAARR